MSNSPKVRQTQEERRRNTQANVLNAAITVLFERGYANFTTAEVAARAGVSRGAQMNYFRTRDDLVLATGRHVLQRSREEAVRAAERAVASTDVVEAFLKNAKGFFLGKNYTAMMEVTLAARTDPKFAREIVSLLTEYRRALNKIWVDAFCRAGYERGKAEQVIRLTNHVYRGMALTAVWAGNSEEDSKLRAQWADTVRQLLSGNHSKRSSRRATMRQPEAAN